MAAVGLVFCISHRFLGADAADLGNHTLHFVFKSAQCLPIWKRSSVSPSFRPSAGSKIAGLSFCSIALNLAPWDIASGPDLAYVVLSGMLQNKAGLGWMPHIRGHRMSTLCTGRMNSDRVARFLLCKSLFASWLVFCGERN